MSLNGRGTHPPSAHKVLIIGAGSTGRALAQGLKKKGIPFTIYEKDASPQARDRNWTFGLHWGVELLRELVPTHVFAQIEASQIESAKFYPLRRDKFRVMLLTDLAQEVQWGKELEDIIYSHDGATVTTKFTVGAEDTGSILIATDGPYSKTQHALFLRLPPHHPLYQVGPHPKGYCGWLSLHDGDDIDHAENWIFFHHNSFPEPKHDINHRTNREHVLHQKELAKHSADPWRSVFEWVSEDTPVWYSKSRNWDPSLPEHRWDSHLGRVTMAGDAAHPMALQRGQGLNHAIMDAYTVCKAIDSFWGDSTVEIRARALQLYEAEMIQRIGRGGEAK
ncbi:hypothetical protein BBP40_009461 [Aspergillus hancockii]|nr:hypothetical protein BBP40_009461 [Aspergillus hancockii]